MKIVDAKGKQCPIPVAMAVKALAELHEGESIQVLVDNTIAVENLMKMAQQKECTAEQSATEDGNYAVTITVKKAVSADTTGNMVSCQPVGETVVVLSSDAMGSGNDELGRALMKGFVFALTQMEKAPDTVLLYNGGARLSSEVPETIEDLKKLEQAGTKVMTCGTCLNFYELTEKLAVGEVTNMYVICEKQMNAAKVIRP